MVNVTNISSSWKILQLGLVVRNMDEAVNRFSALGFGPFIEKLLPPDSRFFDETGESSESKVNVQRSTIGNVELELIEPVSEKSIHRDFLNSKGEGVQHILFEVQDIDAELEKLKEAGANLLFKVVFKGGALAYVDLNAGGLIVELIQLPKEYPEIMDIVLSR